MPVRMDKPWVPADEALQQLRGNLGVFQLADGDGAVLYIGFAGGNSQFGLRGEVADALQSIEGAAQVRWEINTAYSSRYRELLMAHVADHGASPPANPPMQIGKLSPA